MKHIRSILLTALFVAMIIGIFTACSGSNDDDAQSDDEGELADQLYFFNWGANIDPKILEDFEEEYGVEVIYDTFASNEEMLTKLTSGTANYDIVVPTDYYIERMVSEDLLHELDMDNIPNFDNIQEDLKSPAFDENNQYTVPYLYGSTGIAYNKEKIDTPTSWEVLWDSKYENKVVLQPNARQVVTMGLQILDLERESPTIENIEKAKEFLMPLGENVHSYDDEPAAKLISEEVWIAQAYSDQAGQAMEQNPNIDFIIPEEEGGFLWMDNFVVPKSSQNKYTAEVFINYMLEPEVSKMLTDYIPSSNPNAAAIELMSEDEQENRASYPDIPKNAEYYHFLDPEPLDLMSKALNEIKLD